MGRARMARVNLIVDKEDVGKLRRLLGTHSDSETVRAAGTATGMALLQMLDRQMPDERRPRLDADPVRLSYAAPTALRH
mgnify:CR=1 FL=1